jgi:inorganic pyrophosphatase
MTNFAKIPCHDDDGNIHVVIETPRGGRAKLKYDPRLKAFTLSKSLMLGLTYPYDWGFIPSTAGDDGDPLDVMVLHDAATTPGLVLTCQVIGVLEAVDEKKGKKQANDRIIAVPLHSHLEKGLDNVHQLSTEQRMELEKFFIATDELESKKFKCKGWRGPAQAKKLVKAGAKRHRKQNGKG